MIVTQGGRFGGYGLFMSKGVVGFERGRVVFLYNLLDLKWTIWEGPDLSSGKHTIVFDFKSEGPGLGKGGTGVLPVDGKEVDKKSMEQTTPITFPEDETLPAAIYLAKPPLLITKSAKTADMICISSQGICGGNDCSRARLEEGILWK